MVVIVERTLTLLAQLSCDFLPPLKDYINAVQLFLHAFGMQTVLGLLDQLSDVDLAAVVFLKGSDHLLRLDAPSLSSLHEGLEHAICYKLLGEAISMRFSEHFITCLFALKGFHLKSYEVVHGPKDVLQILRIEEVLLSIVWNFLGSHEHELHLGNDEVNVYHPVVEELELFE